MLHRKAEGWALELYGGGHFKEQFLNKESDLLGHVLLKGYSTGCLGLFKQSVFILISRIGRKWHWL